MLHYNLKLATFNLRFATVRGLIFYPKPVTVRRIVPLKSQQKWRHRMEQIQGRVFVIPLHGQTARITGLCYRWGDIVLTQDVELKPTGKKKTGETIKAGCILRRNRELGRTSKAAKRESEYMVYQDLYDLVRAGEHIDKRYGTVEFDQLEALKSKARQYVQYLIYVKSVAPEDREAAYAAFAEAIDALSAKRSPRKVVARDRFSEAVSKSGMEYFRDSLGRPNRPAAAMRVGAGIGHLNERWGDVGHIAARTDLRTIEAHAAINEHLITYWDAWYSLHPVGDFEYSSAKAIKALHLHIPKGAVGPVRIGNCLGGSSEELVRLASQLGQWREKFLAIQERPFRNNAKHMADDAQAAIAACAGGDRVVLGDAMERMRNGISWMFALHVLQSSYITPLSMLLARLEREHGKFKPLRKGDAVIVDRALASDAFAQLEGAILSFENRVLRCSDAGLEHRIKHAVLAQAAILEALMKSDNWLEAKRRALLLAQKF